MFVNGNNRVSQRCVIAHGRHYAGRDPPLASLCGNVDGLRDLNGGSGDSRSGTGVGADAPLGGARHGICRSTRRES